MVMVSSLVAKARLKACDKRDNNSNKALGRENDIVSCRVESERGSTNFARKPGLELERHGDNDG